MSLKINPSLSIELAEDVGNGKFLLHGHNNLDGIIPYIKEMQEGLFSNHYDAGDYILYEASLVSDGQKHFQEIGLGIFSIEDNKCFIQRRHALYCIDEDGNETHPSRLLQFFCNDDRDKCVIQSYIPKDIREVLYAPHSVVSCESPHVPSAVIIDNDSLLGRLEDDVDSIPIDSLFSPKRILNVLTKITRMIKLSCSFLEVKKLRTPHLEFKPVKSPAAKEGVCYYDKDDKVLKFYNGTEWISLS